MADELYAACICKPTYEFSKLIENVDPEDVNDAVVGLCDTIVKYDDIMMELFAAPGRKYPIWLFDNIRLLIDKTTLDFEGLKGSIALLEKTDRERAYAPVNKVLSAALNN